MSTGQPLTDDVLIFERVSPWGAWFGGVAILTFGCFFSGFAWVMGGHVPTFVWVVSAICVAIAVLFIGVRSRVVYLARAEQVRSRTLFFGLTLRDRVLGSPPFVLRTEVVRTKSPNQTDPRFTVYLWIHNRRFWLKTYLNGGDAERAARLVRMRLRAISRNT
jgi:hypothetical protein